MSNPTEWYKTGDARIVPWHFGLMRAEFMERRDFSSCGEITSFQTRWVSSGKFPWEMDITSPYGFWSTMSTPIGDTKKFGMRAMWRGFITYFKSNEDKL